MKTHCRTGQSSLQAVLTCLTWILSHVSKEDRVSTSITFPHLHHSTLEPTMYPPSNFQQKLSSEYTKCHPLSGDETPSDIPLLGDGEWAWLPQGKVGWHINVGPLLLRPLSSPPSEYLQEVVSEKRFGISFEAFLLDEPFLLLIDCVIPNLCVAARRICCDDVCFVARLSFHLVPRPYS